MASKFECPRCGSGIKPGDVQCDRCGETLRKVEKKLPPRQAPVRELICETRTEPKPELGEVDNQKRLEMLQRERDLQIKERKLTEKEARIADMMESLERDSSTLEETMGIFEAQKAILQEKQESMLEREDLLVDLMQRVEAGLSELSSYIEKGRTDELSKDEMDKAIELSKKFFTTYESERKRIKKGIMEFDVADLGRVIELEAMLRSTEDRANKYRVQLEERKELESSAAVSVMPSEELMQDIGDAIDEQVGIGYTESTRGTPITVGIDRLDNILGGGVPSGHLILLTGPPGSMKSTLAFNIIYNVSEIHKSNCLYISLEQSRESLMKQMARLNMSMDKVGDRLIVVDMIGLRTAKKDEPGDWRSILLRYVKNIYAEKKFNMFVLDSLGSFRSITSHEFTRQDLQDLFDWFRELGITVIMIAESGISDAPDISQEAYLSDGVVELKMKELNDSRVQRWMRVIKMRGMNIDTRYYALLHNGDHFIMTLPMAESSKGP
ncbi:MAG: ATPase domain-containing protein [Methanomassiliicoccales archaeon]|jgi:KaiC/GvpD/RAD55 family RecA-like ATPase